MVASFALIHQKQITLVFTAADKADGADAIISTLKKYGIKVDFLHRWSTNST